MNPECCDLEPRDRKVTENVLLRKAPDEEEEDEEDEREKEDDENGDDDNEDGYSE